MIHLNITITGKVQKVGFRFLTMQTASKLGVRGFVMYVDSDKIYIEAEGPEDKMEEFKKWCRTGPMPARVDHIRIDTGELKYLKSFEILSRNSVLIN
jgi:acylphosphatase